MLGSSKLTWAAASVACQSWSINGQLSFICLGSCLETHFAGVSNVAMLVSVQSSEENTFVSTFAPTELKWLGGHRNATLPGFPFYWVDGTPFTYTDWAPGEPNFQNGNEYCLRQGIKTLSDKTQWNDAVCTQSSKYVCKRPLPARLSFQNHCVVESQCFHCSIL